MATKVSKGGEKERARVPRSLRADYGLSLPLFATMAGAPSSALQKWEEGRGELESGTLERLDRVGRILGRLARVMRRSFIPTWLEQPNDACKELGVRAPLDLLARWNYEEIEGLIFSQESGVPG